MRGRLGWVATPGLLVYASGGLAYGGVTAHNSFFQSWSGDLLGPFLQSPGTVGSFSDTRVGWTVGGGLEWLFLPNWSAKVEYLHYDLGTVRFASGPLVTNLALAAIIPGSLLTFANTVIPTTHTRFDGDIVRIGVNYHFI